jgi:hypothetical protein
MSLTKVTYAMIEDAPANVADYGAVGDGVTDDTAAFTAALAVSKSIYVPYTDDSFLVDGLNVDFGVKIWGPGTIKTGAGNLVQLGNVDITPDAGLMRVMFVAGTNMTWEEFLNIKALGYNTIMPYLWNVALDVVIKNAEAVGLNLIVHTRFVAGNQAQWATLAAAATVYNDRPSVVGYYVFDEPIGNGITAANQDIGIAAVVNAGGTKPIMTAEYSVIFSNTAGGGNEYLSAAYDVIFLDVYYPDSYTSANESIGQYLYDYALYGAINFNAKLIPLVGLFNDTGGFGKSESATVSLAEYLVRFSQDMQFGVFCWDQEGNINKDVRNTASYYESAATLPSMVKSNKPFQVNPVFIGTVSTPGASNLLSSIIVNTVDATTPNIEGGQSNVVPWYVEDVGSAVNNRQQDFSANGLMIQNNGGRIGFSGMPTGYCAAFFQWSNRDDGAACSVNIGASETLGYNYVSAISTAIADATSEALQGKLESAGNFNLMPVLEISVVSAVTFPYCFLSGFIVFSNANDVGF